MWGVCRTQTLCGPAAPEELSRSRRNLQAIAAGDRFSRSDRRKGRLGASFGKLDPVVGDLLRHRRVRHGQQARDLRAVPAGVREQPLDVELLELGKGGRAGVLAKL